MTDESIRDCIIRLDANLLGVQTVRSLKDIVPSPEELKNIQNYIKHNDKNLLDTADKLALCVCTHTALTYSYHRFQDYPKD
jgi:hypothetical protein